MADVLAVQVFQHGGFAHGHALLGDQGHALAGQAGRVVQLGQHHIGTDKAPGARAAAAAHFLHGPVQASLYGGGGDVEIVAVQAQARFQAQRVARAQANGLNFRLCQQGARQGFGLRGGYGDFKAVFARVAAARHQAVGTGDGQAGAGHEHQLRRARCQARQHGSGLRALQRQQGLVGQWHHLAALANLRLDVGDVPHLTGAVDDDEDFIRPHAQEHQVVDDAARLVQQQAVALLAHGQVDHIDGHQRLERGGGVGADEAQLAHVRDIEQTGLRARVQVLGHQARRVLHGHGITSKGHHARAQFEVQCVQGRGQQGGGGRGGHGQISRANRGRGLGWPRNLPCCPLYLRDSPGIARAAPGLLLRWTATVCGCSRLSPAR